MYVENDPKTDEGIFLIVDGKYLHYQAKQFTDIRTQDLGIVYDIQRI